MMNWVYQAKSVRLFWRRQKSSLFGAQSEAGGSGMELLGMSLFVSQLAQLRGTCVWLAPSPRFSSQCVFSARNAFLCRKVWWLLEWTCTMMAPRARNEPLLDLLPVPTSEWVHAIVVAIVGSSLCMHASPACHLLGLPCVYIAVLVPYFVAIHAMLLSLRSLTRWYSRVAIQGMKQEIMDGLKLCMQASLKKYHEVTKLPIWASAMLLVYSIVHVCIHDSRACCAKRYYV